MGRTRELSWSLSRARMFGQCPRCFYYHYYLSQAGYAPDASEEARLALEMRRIKGLDMWIGEVVHETIQWVLEQAHEGKLPAEQDAKAHARQKLSDGWRGSRQQLWRKLPEEQCPNLFEHYYGLEVPPQRTDRLKEKAFLSVANFMESDLLKRIAGAPTHNWLPIDRYASFRLDGLLFYVKFDFALKQGNKLTIYDWKTGKQNSEESRQLACYAMYTSSKWGIPIENVTACAVHLQPELDSYERLVNEEDVDEVRTYAKNSFNRMIECLRDPARNVAVVDDFPTTGSQLACVRCNFVGICGYGKTALGEVDDLPPVEGWEEG